MNGNGISGGLKQSLAEGKTTLGLWVTLESPTITEIATVMGLVRHPVLIFG